MTVQQLAHRLDKLEQTVAELSQTVPRSGAWYVAQAGQFKDDPVYADIVRRGRAYRKSLRRQPREKALIILDTDIISILDTQSGNGYENLSRHLNSPQIDRVCVTIVSVEEQMRGWLSYIAASRTTSRQVEGYLRLRRMIEAYQQREVLDFDSRAAGVFDDLKRARIRIGPMDLKIAAIALSHDALLVSRNLRDFRRVPNLRVEDWTQ